jgi:hypothetical protein
VSTLEIKEHLKAASQPGMGTGLLRSVSYLLAHGSIWVWCGGAGRQEGGAGVGREPLSEQPRYCQQRWAEL